MSADPELIELILNNWNNTSKKVLKELCLHQLFESQVVKQPKAIALSTKESSLSYEDLNVKANHIAKYLVAKGVCKSDFVGILMSPSPEQIIFLIAIHKIGAAYVPMNIKDPLDRILEIVKSANLKHVISDIEILNSINDFNIYSKKELQNIMLKGNSENLNLVIETSLPAYIIFTSGSTGKPKGVLVTHQKVSNLIEWVNTTFEITNTDKLIWSTNLCFDLSVYDIFGSLAAGACVRILNAEERLNPEQQFQILLNEGITFWDSAPQSMQQVGTFFHKSFSGDYSKLRLVFLSGDWIPLKLADEIKSVFHNAKVVSLGGATEATIWSNYYVIDKVNPAWRSIPYGKPIQNARYYILNEDLTHCELDRKGDLFIGGPVLAREYFGDAELTDKKFVNDPFYPNHKMFKTGDKAQWMPDGNIEFLGREDDQLKVRGYRVEVGEIKSVALQINYIKDAIVLADKTDKFNAKVILFFTCFDNVQPDTENLKEHLRKGLPEYMIPSVIHYIDQIPVTGNGKADLSKLMEIYNQKSTDNNILDNSALTIIERQLAEIWIEVLKIKNINPDDNFFDVGGNSILSAFIVYKIELKFNIKFNIKNFFENPRIDALSKIIDCKINLSKEGVK